MLNKGLWNGKRILPAEWIEACITPCPIAPGYGYLWWLNPTDNKIFPTASNSSFFALGVGSQVLYIDPENNLVIVVRWIEKDRIANFVEKVLSALSTS